MNDNLTTPVNASILSTSPHIASSSANVSTRNAEDTSNILSSTNSMNIEQEISLVDSSAAGDMTENLNNSNAIMLSTTTQKEISLENIEDCFSSPSTNTKANTSENTIHSLQTSATNLNLSASSIQGMSPTSTSFYENLEDGLNSSSNVNNLSASVKQIIPSLNNLSITNTFSAHCQQHVLKCNSISDRKEDCLNISSCKNALFEGTLKGPSVDASVSVSLDISSRGNTLSPKNELSTSTEEVSPSVDNSISEDMTDSSKILSIPNVLITSSQQVISSSNASLTESTTGGFNTSSTKNTLSASMNDVFPSVDSSISEDKTNNLNMSSIPNVLTTDSQQVQSSAYVSATNSTEDGLNTPSTMNSPSTSMKQVSPSLVNSILVDTPDSLNTPSIPNVLSTSSQQVVSSANASLTENTTDGLNNSSTMNTLSTSMKQDLPSVDGSFSEDVAGSLNMPSIPNDLSTSSQQVVSSANASLTENITDGLNNSSTMNILSTSMKQVLPSVDSSFSQDVAGSLNMPSIPNVLSTSSQQAIYSANASLTENIKDGLNNSSTMNILSTSLKQVLASVDSSFSEDVAGSLNMPSIPNVLSTSSQQAISYANASLTENITDGLNNSSTMNTLSTSIKQVLTSVDSSFSEDVADSLNMPSISNVLSTSSQQVISSANASLSENITDGLNNSSTMNTLSTSMKQVLPSVDSSFSEDVAGSLNMSSIPNVLSTSLQQIVSSANASATESTTNGLNTSSTMNFLSTRMEKVSPSMNSSTLLDTTGPLDTSFVPNVITIGSPQVVSSANTSATENITTTDSLNTSSTMNTLSTSMKQVFPSMDCSVSEDMANSSIMSSIPNVLTTSSQRVVSSANASLTESATDGLNTSSTVSSLSTNMKQVISSQIDYSFSEAVNNSLNSPFVTNILTIRSDEAVSSVNASVTESILECLNSSSTMNTVSTNMKKESSSVNSFVSENKGDSSGISCSSCLQAILSNSTTTCDSTKDCLNISTSVNNSGVFHDHIGMESTLGIRHIFNSTLNESTIKCSTTDVRQGTNESLNVSNISLSFNSQSLQDFSIPEETLDSSQMLNSTDNNCLKLVNSQTDLKPLLNGNKTELISNTGKDNIQPNETGIELKSFNCNETINQEEISNNRSSLSNEIESKHPTRSTSINVSINSNHENVHEVVLTKDFQDNNDSILKSSENMLKSFAEKLIDINTSQNMVSFKQMDTDCKPLTIDLDNSGGIGEPERSVFQISAIKDSFGIDHDKNMLKEPQQSNIDKVKDTLNTSEDNLSVHSLKINVVNGTPCQNIQLGSNKGCPSLQNSLGECLTLQEGTMVHTLKEDKSSSLNLDCSRNKFILNSSADNSNVSFKPESFFDNVKTPEIMEETCLTNQFYQEPVVALNYRKQEAEISGNGGNSVMSPLFTSENVTPLADGEIYATNISLDLEGTVSSASTPHLSLNSSVNVSPTESIQFDSEKSITDFTPDIEKTQPKIELSQQTSGIISREGDRNSLKKSLFCSFRPSVGEEHLNTNNMDLTIITEMQKGKVNNMNTSDVIESVDLLDFTCKPEATLLGEDSIIVSHSVIGLEDAQAEKDPVANTSDLKGVYGKAIIERCFKRCMPSEWSGESPLKKIPSLDCSLNDSGETSGCALDYTLSVSGNLACDSLQHGITANSNKNIPQKSNHIEALPNLKSTDRSFRKSVNVPQNKLIPSDISYIGSEISYLNIPHKTIDIRQKLSESINRSICLGRKIPNEEVQSLKENLVLIMDLLEKENSEFEIYKKACENEKMQLLSKIEYLQKQVFDKSSDIANSVVPDKDEEDLKTLKVTYDIVETDLKKCQDELEWFKKMSLLTDSDLHEIDEIFSYLKSLGISTGELISVENDHAVVPKNILSALSLLLTKYKSSSEEYNNLIKNIEQEKVRFMQFEDQMSKYEEEQNYKFNNLKAESEKLEAALKDNIEQCQFLESSNQKLRFDLELRENEIYKLQTDFTSSREEIKSLQEKDQFIISDLEKRYSELKDTLSGLEKSKEDLIIQLKDKSCAYDELNGAYLCLKSESVELNSSITALQKEVEKAKEQYITLEAKYESAKEELVSAHDLRNNHASLVSTFTTLQAEHDHYKSDTLPKIEKLNYLTTINKEMEEETNTLRTNIEYLMQTTVSKNEFDAINAKLNENSEELLNISEKYSKEKEYSARILDDLNNKDSLNNELKGWNEDLKKENTTLKNELSKVKNDYDYLESQKGTLASNYEMAQTNLFKLNTLEKDYSDLKQLYEESSNSFKSVLDQKNSECEGLKKLNQMLETEVKKLSSLLDDSKKLVENNAIQMATEYELLKDEFFKQCQLLDKTKTELDSLRTAHSCVTNNLALSNILLNSAEECNIILRTEFKQVLSNFGEINLKYKKAEIIQNQLKEQHHNVLLSMKSLESNYNEKLMINERYANEIASLHKTTAEVTKKLTDLEISHKCITADYENQASLLSSLKSDYDETKSKYEENLTYVVKLEDRLSQELETINCLRGELSSVNNDLNEARNNLLNLKNDLNSMVSISENESSNLKTLKDDYSRLQETYNETLSKLEQLKKEYLEKGECELKYESEIGALTSEINVLREKIGCMEMDYNRLKSDHESTCMELIKLREQYTGLELNFIEAVANLDTLKKECIEKDRLHEDYKRGEESLKAEIGKIREDQCTLKSENAEIKAVYENKCGEYDLLKHARDELSSKCEDLLKSLRKVESEYSMKVEINEKHETEINKLREELSKINEMFLNLKIEHKELSSNYESGTKMLESVQNEFRSLNDQYSETLLKLKHLEEECSVKTDNSIELEKELSEVKEQLENVTEKYSSLNNEYEVLMSNYKEECVKQEALQNLFKELEKKYEQCLSDSENTKKEYLEQRTENEKLEENVGALSIELNNEKEKVSVLETDYENLILKHETECSLALTDLSSKYEEVMGNLQMSHQECLEKDATNEKLKNELHLLNEEVVDIRRKYTDLESEHKALQKELETERLNSLHLKTTLQEFENKSMDMFSKLEKLEKDYLEKIAENAALEEKNKSLISDIGNLNNGLEKIQEESNGAKEKHDLLLQENILLKNELKELHDEKEVHKNIESRNSELNAKCEQLESDLNTKSKTIEDLDSLVQTLNEGKSLLEAENERLIKESSHSTSLANEMSSSLKDLKETNQVLENDLIKKHSELNNVLLKIEKFKHFEDVILSYREDYSFFKDEYSKLQDEFSQSENPVIDIFFASLENILKCVSAKNEDFCKIKSSVLEKQFEIDSLNNQIKLLTDNIHDMENKSLELMNEHSSFKEKHELLLNSYNVIKEKYDSVQEKFNELSTENSKLNEVSANIARETEEKDRQLLGLLEVQGKYETLLSKNKSLISQLCDRNNEIELLKTELVQNKATHGELNNEVQKLLRDVEILEMEKREMGDKMDNYHSQSQHAKEEAMRWEKESEALRIEKSKYEREYQSAVDSLHSAQEQMCKVERDLDEKMARFTFILKEKENFENRTLSLLKQNDELSNKIRELTGTSKEYEKSYSKLLQLQSEFTLLSDEKTMLEKKVCDLDKMRRECTDLKAELIVKDSQINELKTDFKQLKSNYQKKSDEMEEMCNEICSKLPGCKSSSDIVKSVEKVLSQMKIIEEELKEEKIKSENLDEECEILNKDITYKDKMLGDLYQQHSEELAAVKEALEKNEKECKEYSEENKTLRSTIEKLEAEITNIKITEPVPCTACVEMKRALQKSKLDLVERESKISSLQLDLEQHQTSLKKKIQEYRKKVISLQEELGGALNKLKETERNPSSECATQTDPTPLQLSGQGGIVHTIKIKEQEDKIQKIEKENMLLKKVCHNRLQTIKDLQMKLENGGQSQPKKPQRNVLEEVQNK